MTDQVTTEEAPAENPAPRQLTPFEVKVFSVALANKNNNGWCDDGFNTAMRELGLPTKPYINSNHTDVVVSVPTTGVVEYRFNSSTSREMALARAKERAESDANLNRLEYGRRGGPLQFNFDNATVTGLPGETPTDPEQAQWLSALAQVEAYRKGNPDADSADADEDDDE
jgi:hypothetical protein